MAGEGDLVGGVEACGRGEGGVDAFDDLAVGEMKTEMSPFRCFALSVMSFSVDFWICLGRSRRFVRKGYLGPTAVVAQLSILARPYDVGNPVVDRRGTANRDDNLLLSSVDSDEAENISQDAP